MSTRQVPLNRSVSFPNAELDFPINKKATGNTPMAALRDFVSVVDFGADPTGLSDSSGAISAAFASHSHVLCPVGAYLLLNNVTVPFGKTLEFQNGAVLSIHQPATFYLEGTIEAGNWQIFSGHSNVVVPGNRRTTGNGVYNVKWWGAKGDEITDDGDAIQAAVLTAAGATLCFPSGGYVVHSRTLLVDGNLNVIGEGLGRNSVIYPMNFADGQAVFKFSGCDGVSIRNLLFSGEGTRSAICFRLENFKRGVIENVHSTNSKTVISAGANVYINTFREISQDGTGGWVVVAEGAGFNTNTFVNCTFGGDGFYMHCERSISSGITFVGCSFEGCGGRDMSQGACHIKTTGEGRVAGITFLGCYWESTAKACINLEAGEPNSIGGISISGCYFHGGLGDSSPFAIKATNAFGIVLVGNYIEEFTSAVFSANNSGGWLVEGNCTCNTPRLTMTSDVLGGAGGYLKNNTLGRKESHGHAKPSAGPAKLGDISWNNGPTSGGYVGWVCTQGGNPGTWMGFGVIE